MLFTKKERLALGERCIKEEVAGKDGTILVKLNLKCPEIQTKKREPLAVFAKGFYNDFINSFAEYARTELCKAAFEEYSASPESFAPYSALMRYSVTRFDERFLSVVLDVSVSDGKGNISSERSAQVWEREYGTKCKASYFFTKNKLDEFLLSVLPKKSARRVDRDNFALTEKGFELYVKQEDGYTALYPPCEKNEEKF